MILSFVKQILPGMVAVAGVLGTVVAVVTLVTPGTSHAQDCDNPFEGENIRFSTGFWEKTNFCLHSVSYSEIRSGGPPPDGIPPIDNPVFESIEAADEWLEPQSPVIAVEINGDARAYPQAILTWHEIANDVIGDVPVAVTFCPLCNSSIVFDRRMNGEVLRLGVSGNLRNSDMVMWDDLTESWWQQLTGEAIVGDFTGEMLTMVPSQVVAFGDFAEQFPDGQVLSRDTNVSRPYGQNPYSGYDSNSRPFLFEGEIDDRLPAMQHVLAGIVSGAPVAYPFSVLSDVQVINDTVENTDVVVFWQDGVVSALDASTIDESRPIGTAGLYSREFDGQTLTFAVDDSGAIIDEQTGSTWNAFGTATSGELEGSQLRKLVSGPHFWFAWAAFQPETSIYGL